MKLLSAARTSSHLQANTDAGQRVLLNNVLWQTYKTVRDALADRNVRLTFDRGTLEIMVVSTAHERFKTLIGLLITSLAEGLNKLIGGFGSFTHQREDLVRALEPDQCYYLQHFQEVRGKRHIDLTREPPPDLAVEVEISRSVLDRLEILAALGIPEVWRFDGQGIHVLLLHQGQYEPSPNSLSFPEINIGKLVTFLSQGEKEGDIAMMRHAREWASKQRLKSLKKRKP